MSSGSKPPITKPSYCQTFKPYMPNSCLYHKYDGLSSIFTVKNHTNFHQKMWKNLQKNIKRFDKYLKIQEKISILRNLFYAIGFGTYSGSPAKFRGFVMFNSIISLAKNGEFN